jgi:phospholipid transport system substrate-binding protein
MLLPTPRAILEARVRGRRGGARRPARVEPMNGLRLRLFSLLAVALAAGAAAPARADTAAAGRDLVETIGAGVLALIADKRLDDRGREARFRAVYRAHFDNAAIAAWALGPAWRRATDQERAEFARLFEGYLVRAVAAKLADYRAERLLILKSERDGAAVIVTTHLVDPDPRASRNIEIRWRLGQSGGRLKVLDVTVDKISIAATLRRDIGRMLDDGGGTLRGLLAALRQQRAAER